MTSLEVTSIKYGQASAPGNATYTHALPWDEVRNEIARVVEGADNLAEDLALAVVVRTRLERTSEGSMPLRDFIRQEGFDPGEFGLE